VKGKVWDARGSFFLNGYSDLGGFNLVKINKEGVRKKLSSRPCSRGL